jgi:thiol-disulfide isomerase/thioredoxin
MPEPIVPKSIDETKMPGSSFRYFKEHYFDNFDFSDERLLYTPIFHAKIDKYLNQLTPQHPDSISVSADFLVNKSRANKENFKWMVWYITNIYEQSKVMGFDAVFVHMAENYYCKGEAFWIDTAKLTKICDRAAHLKKINLGAVVPNMFLEDTTLNGRFIYDLMKNDKYTIFWFWNSGCGHCQKETPELYKKWKEISKDLNIGVISITEERLGGKEEPEMNRWKKYFRDHPMPEWKNLRDANNYYDFKDMFDVYATPKLFIVESATHKIIAKSISVEQIDDVIKQYEKFEKNKDKPNNK